MEIKRKSQIMLILQALLLTDWICFYTKFDGLLHHGTFLTAHPKRCSCKQYYFWKFSIVLILNHLVDKISQGLQDD